MKPGSQHLRSTSRKATNATKAALPASPMCPVKWLQVIMRVQAAIEEAEQSSAAAKPPPLGGKPIWLGAGAMRLPADVDR